MVNNRKSASANSKRTIPFSSSSQQGNLTSEGIANDMAAFDKAGGKIEVLGNTPLRGKDGTLKHATEPAPSNAAGSGKN